VVVAPYRLHQLRSAPQLKYSIALAVLIFCGCHNETGYAAASALRIMGPAHVVLNQANDLIAFSPQLSITNTANVVRGITRFGGQISISKLEYRLTDANGAVIPIGRRDFLGSTLAGMRISTTLLRPNESTHWTPDESLVYFKIAKGHYWLVAHLEIKSPDPLSEGSLSDEEKAQIHPGSWVLDSDPFELSVE